MILDSFVYIIVTGFCHFKPPYVMLLKFKSSDQVQTTIKMIGIENLSQNVTNKVEKNKLSSVYLPQ